MRRGRVACIGCIALAGCGLALTGAGDPDGGLASGDAGVIDALAAETSDRDTGGGDVEIDTGPPPSSCKEIKARDPESPSGKKIIVRPGRGALEVLCEMQTVGGGFMLVGRSAPSGNSNSFGWMSATGAIDNLSAPYSLDTTGFEFSEVMIVEWTGFGAPTRGVVVDVPPAFLTTYTTTQIDVRALAGATFDFLGSCTKQNLDASQQMIRRLGYTNTKTHFHIRDVSSLDVFGLRPDRFELDGTGCDRSMDLEDRRGAIWVR